MKRLALLLLVLVTLAPLTAQAWWSGDWKYRKKITVNTSPTGADLKEGVANGLVAVRLHSGNFLFTDAKPDGSDLRFVANDDKTPLKHFVEFFDSTNQLALVWVQLPHVSAASSADFFYLYSGNEKAPVVSDPKGVYDGQQLLALEFGEAQPPFKDLSAYTMPVSGDSIRPDANGLFGAAGAFDGTPARIGPAATLHVAAGGGFTFSAWVRPADANPSRLFSWGPLAIAIENGQAVVHLGKESFGGGKVAAGAWTHIAASFADKSFLYVNGVQVAGGGPLPELAGEAQVGDGFHGSIDSLGLASAARSGAWVQLASVQGEDGRLLGYGESEAGEDAGGTSYIKILFSSLTMDAKVVIAILGVMFVIAVSVMVRKTIQLGQMEKGNGEFLRAFEADPITFLDPASGVATAFDGGTLPNSSLARMYEVGIRELRLRLKSGRAHGLPAESVAAIKASIDATLIRQNQRINSLMVLLTIAISGGPFLGLLGTVVGVMITFASIAAAGDVNINAIAPGIAAALLATVAGLGVAIPSLFGYNYLITKIKAIGADMQAFSDEFICRMAEAHNQ